MNMSLEDIIKTYVPLGRAMPSGWIPVLCKVCGDRGHKGKRAAFKFENEKIAYNCFNCKAKAGFDPHTNTKISDEMIRVLNDFGVPADEYRHVEFDLVSNHGKSAQRPKKSPIPANIEPAELVVPPHFYRLDDNAPRDIWYELSVDYLKYERGIDYHSYPFYLSTGGVHDWEEDWKGRIIIPIYKDDKLIYYQGRDLTNTKILKYKSPSEPKDKVMSGYDQVYRNTTLPLFVVEGFFDSFVIDGAGLLGNEVTATQLIHLKRSRREKIYIPDKFGDGHVAAQTFINNGWSISTPEFGSCKDVNEAVVKYGKIYVIKTITENIVSGERAQLALGVYCSDGKEKENKY